MTTNNSKYQNVSVLLKDWQQALYPYTSIPLQSYSITPSDLGVLNQSPFIPHISPSHSTLNVVLDDGSITTISRSELVKYISDRTIREENEVVRTLWDRYQVAIKLVRSNDDGDN